MRQIVLDTETTGLRVEDGHRLIEIGCLEMCHRKLTGQKYHTYINPQREVEAGAMAVHGITNEFLADKPLFQNIVDELLEFLGESELIIHNAPFDLSFINHELQLLKQSRRPITDTCRVIDTLQLARQLHVGQRNSLDALCKRYKIDNSKRESHGALLDSYLLAEVYLAMTGGQGSFFDAKTTTHTPAEKRAEQALPQLLTAHQLVVLKATDDELAAHAAYLEMLKKKGRCQWEDS